MLFHCCNIPLDFIAAVVIDDKLLCLITRTRVLIFVHSRHPPKGGVFRTCCRRSVKLTYFLFWLLVCLLYTLGFVLMLKTCYATVGHHIEVAQILYTWSLDEPAHIKDFSITSHHFLRIFVFYCILTLQYFIICITRSSAIAEWPRDASCQY